MLEGPSQAMEHIVCHCGQARPRPPFDPVDAHPQPAVDVLAPKISQ